MHQNQNTNPMILLHNYDESIIPYFNNRQLLLANGWESKIRFRLINYNIEEYDWVNN